MNIKQILEEKREEILRIATKHGVQSIRVFGSVARGEATSRSDVDFIVEPGPQTSPWFPAGLIADLEELLGCEVDVVTKDALHWYIRDQVLEEAIPL